MSAITTMGRSTLNRYIAALAYRDFRNMWLANLSAQSAAWALIVARGWLVYDETGSSFMVGAVTFAAMAPMFFVPPFAGVLADRMDRRTLLSYTYAINLFHNLALALLALTGVITIWHLMLLSLVNGSARAAQMSTTQALAVSLVPREKLLNALSLSAGTMHATRLVGPGLVTPLFGILGAPAAFFFCTALYALGWFQVMRIKAISRGGVKKGEKFLASFADGLRYTWGQPLMRMVLIMVFLHCGLTMAFESLLPTFSVQRLGGGVAGFGTLMAGVGAGGLVGSFLIGGINSSLTRGRLYLVTGLLSGLGQVGLSFAPNMATAVVATALMGCSQAAFMTLGQAITQSLASDEYRGRLASINTFSLGGVMSSMVMINGMLGNSYAAASLLFVQGLIFVGIMVFSIALTTPRRVYAKGLPADAHAALAVNR